MSINLMSAIFRTEFRDLQDGDGNTTKASTAKFVCIALADHANDEGEGAYPSIAKLAYKTSLSRTAVINALDALKYNGILTANGTSKWDTVNYTVNQACFSKDSQPSVLVNWIDPPSQLGVLPPVNPVDPNHPLTILKPSNKTDETKGTYTPKGIEQKIWAGLPVEQSDLDNGEEIALDAFQSALQTPLNWNWYPAKTTEEKTWRDFRSYVLSLYQTDKNCFTKYQTWRTQPYARGAMSNLAIKRNPENFPASWSDFLASTSMYSKQESKPVEFDADGTPASY